MIIRDGRQIFTFPAVHPCKDIRPAILLVSLIDISNRISNFRMNLFTSQKRKAREVIRQIGILQMFFEEMLVNLSVFNDSVFIGFFDLHVIFQKVLFLFEDCTRDGARLLILMKSDFVALQFGIFFKAFSRTLDVHDVLPLLSIEIKELVELVLKQSEKAKSEVDREDEEAVKTMILILNQFENQVKPETCTIKKVLDYLEIKTWGDCHKDIIFLEAEIYRCCSNGDDEDQEQLSLLSSLVGFLSYCRGVLFDNESNIMNSSYQIEIRNLETLKFLNLEDFRCPISLELMIDPVTISTGQTYDRISIQKWLNSGNSICPKTGEKLKNTDLIPNSSLMKLIHQFCFENGLSLLKFTKQKVNISRTLLPGSSSSAESIRFLAEYLSCKLCFTTNYEQKNKAAYEMRLLAKSNVYNRVCLINAGAIPPLLGLISTTNNPSLQENAISVLLKLSKQSTGKKEIMGQQKSWKTIIWLLKNGLKPEVKQIAAATCFYLSSIPEYRRMIGETYGTFHGLVNLITEGNNCGKKNSLVAIFGLLLHKENHKKVLETRIIPILIDLLVSTDNDDIKTEALAVLASLSESIDGSFGILSSLNESSQSLQRITGLLQSITTRTGKEYCVSILLSLCNNGGSDVVSYLANDHDSSLMQSLYLVLTEGTKHAVKKARFLIKILHRFTETRSTCFINDVLQRQQHADLC